MARKANGFFTLFLNIATGQANAREEKRKKVLQQPEFGHLHGLNIERLLQRLPSPPISVQAAVMNGFGQVFGAHIFAGGEVGNGAGNF